MLTSHVSIYVFQMDIVSAVTFDMSYEKKYELSFWYQNSKFEKQQQQDWDELIHFHVGIFQQHIQLIRFSLSCTNC